MVKIFNQDCKSLLHSIPWGTVNLFLQDVPFGITQQEWDILPDFKNMWPLWEKVGAGNAAFVFFGSIDVIVSLVNTAPRGFKYYDLIWYKCLGSGHMNAKKRPMRNHEHIIVFYKNPITYNPQKIKLKSPKKSYQSKDRNSTVYGRLGKDVKDRVVILDSKYPESVLNFSNGNRNNGNQHPNQKPINLIRYLVRTFSNKNDLVFDGYLGSGTTAIACAIEERNCIGAETNPHYYSIAKTRLEMVLNISEIKFPE